MEEKFYREKNAKSIKIAEIITPTYAKLKTLLAEKLCEKAEFIKTIYINPLREEYLAKKGKLDESKKLGEEKTITMLATRLSVDFLQLLIDIARHIDTPLNLEKYEDVGFDLVMLSAFITDNANLIKNNNSIMEPSDIIQDLVNCFHCYLKTYNLSLKEIIKECKKVEKKEGSFYNGKIVILD